MELTFDEIESLTETSTLARDLLSLFTHVDLTSSYGYETYGTPFVAELLSRKIILPEDVLKEVLANLARNDFHRTKFLWLRSIAEKIKLSSEETIQVQSELFAVLATQHGVGINWVLQELKPLSRHPAFRWADFLLASELLLIGKHAKLGVSRALLILEELPLYHPAATAETVRVTLPALLVKDASIQEKVIRIVARWSQPQEEWLREELLLYTDILPANAYELLGSFLSSTPPAPIERYVYQPKFIRVLTEDRRITAVTNWEDLLFLIGKVTTHFDVSEVERLLDSLLQQGFDLPTDFQDQVSSFHFEAMSSKTIWLIRGFLQDWSNGFETTALNHLVSPASNDEFITVFWVRMMYAKALAKANQRLSLLSTPTHRPFWIDPEILVERLFAFEKAEVVINEIDLAVAIARLRLEQTEAALGKAQQLRTPNFKTLLTYVLNADQNLQESLDALEPYPFHSIETSNVESFASEEIWPMLLAVAARTKNYLGIYPEFERYAFGTYPNVCRPFETKWDTRTFRVKKDRYYKDSPEIDLLLLSTDAFYYDSNPLPLLYSQHFHGSYLSKYTVWEESKDFEIEPGIHYLFSLLPNQPEPLFFRALRSSGQGSESGPSGTQSTLQGSLTQLLETETPLLESAHLLLAAGILKETANSRQLAMDILAQLISEQRVDADLLTQIIGVLLNHAYSPVQRFVDTLAAMINLSPTHNDVACQLLEGILKRMNAEKPLKNTKKILLQYIDLQQKTARPMPAVLEERLQYWEKSSALKKEVAQLKRSPLTV
ncbi:DUF6493 family protein [Siphonobacter sp. BAB-5385]|uniref:DUF6493 family protein n=1 Tax=Siphonobacter sp. BAB-5385 TaxID=1864822 RepID=UPI000B9E1896|nr:DUF6493 family protein [Siphonobacter sp. BAB-5385]